MCKYNCKTIIKEKKINKMLEATHSFCNSENWFTHKILKNGSLCLYKNPKCYRFAKVNMTSQER